MNILLSQVNFQHGGADKHQYRAEEKKRQDKTEGGERNENRGY
nr:MAG TPA: hypothetical protein [Caudoviricetes sp.]